MESSFRETQREDTGAREKGEGLGAFEDHMSRKPQDAVTARTAGFWAGRRLSRERQGGSAWRQRPVVGAAWQVGPTGAQGRALSPSCDCNFLAQAHRLQGSGSNVMLFPICLCPFWHSNSGHG